MKKFKRFAAILGVVLLLLLFCLPMVFALGKGENSAALFRGAFGAAMLAPILLYVFWMTYKFFGRGKEKQEEKREVENIVFDVGRVLVEFEWEPYLKSFHFPKEKYEKIADVTFRSQTWNERDRGLLEEEEYVAQMVAKAPEYEADIRAVMERTAETIAPLDYAETWTKYLKNQGYHLYVLSNYGDYMLEKTRPQMAFLKYMDGAIFSCEVQQIKPEAEIYKTLLKRYSLKPSKTVFIDDRADNCEAARKLGIRAIQFTSFKQAAAELEKMGVK